MSRCTLAIIEIFGVTDVVLFRRYDLTLRDYLAQNQPTVDECLFLFAQLLEAMVHLKQEQVAHRFVVSCVQLVFMQHPVGVCNLSSTSCSLTKFEFGLLSQTLLSCRDLKSDNILVDTSNLDLVVSDFGCCLADKDYGLRIPFADYSDKGGNVALMAPEVSHDNMWNAIPIVFSFYQAPRVHFHRLAAFVSDRLCRTRS